MGEDRRPGRVDSHGEVVGNERADAFPDGADAVSVGDHLVVGDDEPRLDSRVLKAHAVMQRAEIMADVKMAGRPVARQHAELAGVLLDRLLDLAGDVASLGEGRARLRRLARGLPAAVRPAGHVGSIGVASSPVADCRGVGSPIVLGHMSLLSASDAWFVSSDAQLVSSSVRFAVGRALSHQTRFRHTV